MANKGCTHSRRTSGTRKCRSKKEHEAKLRKVRSSLAKRRIASAARRKVGKMRSKKQARSLQRRPLVTIKV